MNVKKDTDICLFEGVWQMKQMFKKGIYGHPISITNIYFKISNRKVTQNYDQFGEHENKIILEEKKLENISENRNISNAHGFIGLTW